MNTEEQIKMSPKEFERARKEYLKITLRNEEFIPIENFTNELYNGDYAIVLGRRVSMRTYGEKVMGEEE